jgi:hypothetical protein
MKRLLIDGLWVKCIANYKVFDIIDEELTDHNEYHTFK